MTTEKKRNWKPATQLVHSGTLRSQFGEMSEAIFLTQGYVYPTAEAAEATKAESAPEAAAEAAAPAEKPKRSRARKKVVPTEE